MSSGSRDHTFPIWTERRRGDLAFVLQNKNIPAAVGIPAFGVDDPVVATEDHTVIHTVGVVAERYVVVIHKRWGGEVTVRDVTRSGPRCMRDDPEAIEKQLNLMVERGSAKWRSKRPGPTGGRLTRVFQLLTAGRQESSKTKTQILEQLILLAKRDAPPPGLRFANGNYDTPRSAEYTFD